jgi:autophagy-related protein 16
MEFELLGRLDRLNRVQGSSFSDLFARLRAAEATSRSLEAALSREATMKAEMEAMVAAREAEAAERADLAGLAASLSDSVKATRAALADVTSRLEGAEARIAELVIATEEKDRALEYVKQELEASLAKKGKAEQSLLEVRAQLDEVTARFMDIKRKEAEAINAENAREEARAKERSAQELAASVSANVTEQVHISGMGSNMWGRIPEQAVKAFTAHDAAVNGAVFSPDSSRFSTCSDDKTVRVWDTMTLRGTQTLRGGSQGVVNVAYGPTGETLLASNNDHTCTLFAIATEKVKHTLTGHTEKVSACAFNYDGKTAFTGSHDRTAKYWDAEKGYCLRTAICISSCYDVAIMSDGQTLLSGHHDGKLRRWDVRAKDVEEVGAPLPGQITCTRLSPDLRRLLCCSRDNILRVFDVRMLAQPEGVFSTPELQIFAAWTRACWSPDSQYLACGGANGSVFVFDRVSQKVTKTLSGPHKMPVTATAWCPLGGKIVSVDKDKTVVVWA